MPTQPTRQQDPSLLRAILHGCFAVGLFLSISVLGEAISAVGPEYRIGDTFRQLALMFFLAGTGFSYLYQDSNAPKGSKLRRLFGGILLGCAITLFYLFLQPQKFDPKDTQALQIENKKSDKYIEHPYLGFSLLHPGYSFREMNDGELAIMQTSLYKKISLREKFKLYGYVDDKEGSLLLLMLSKELASRDGLNQLTNAIADELSVKDTESELVDKKLAWNAERKEATIKGQVQGTMLRFRAFLSPLGPKKDLYLVALLGLHADPNAFDKVFASFRTKDSDE